MRMEFICNFSHKNSYLGGLAGVTKRSQFIGVVGCTCNSTEIWNGAGSKPVWDNNHSSGWWTV